MIAGCAEEKHSESSGYVDFAFKPMLTRYKADKLRFLGTADTANITITFLSMQQDGYLGMCRRDANGLSIQIDPAGWYYDNDAGKQAVFYHEMGHCDLGIWQHADSNTIMNMYGIDSSFFAANKEALLRTLFLERK